VFGATLAGLLFVMGSAAGGQAPHDADTFFELKIRPVLFDTCFPCHGGKKVNHGLRVDSREALLKGGQTGPAVVPGNPEKSLLIQAIRYRHADIKMPPDKRLPEEVVKDFVSWVEQGAAWPRVLSGLKPAANSERHWAFEPVKKRGPPPDPFGWSENPVDRFIAAKLREHDLKPGAPADKRMLIRRIYFDLIGLPPTPEEVAAFLADDSSEAYAKLVDRLLASPHYGERWGRHWMDVVRYADTAGDNADYPIPEARLYRDYIIDSFNADKPYDQFVQEQLAGDILAKQGPPEKYAERLVATGFLALSRRYATAPYELWHLTMEDTIETTGRAFLGLTLRCARCHDHKFDPITKEDYYALYGFFASTQFPWAGAEEFSSMKRPRQAFVPLLPPKDATALLAPYQQKVKELETQIQLAEKVGVEWKIVQLRNALWQLHKRGLPSNVPGAYAVQEGKPVDMYVHIRGDVNQHGPVVKRDVPKFLAGGEPLRIPDGTSGRVQLAQWLTQTSNPLVARVMVNRIWQHHFGKGIVTTPSNFGVRGEPPTHAELLDWLAARFIESGWSIKTLHRQIVLSKTYQLSSFAEEAAALRDPANRWYGRADRRRLDAEAIRDALLAASGNLDRKRPGPHPFPPIDQWTWTQHNPFKDVYPSRHRSVYLMTQRFQRHPYLGLFDGPDTNTSTEQRTTSTVPQQALFLMNNPFMAEQAEGFARRLIAASNDVRLRIELAHELAWSRPAKPVEAEKGMQYLEQYATQLRAAGVPAARLELETWTSYARVLLSANEFVYLD
jgi:hypothetical protein